jgi:hypothetical protein
VSGFCFGKRIWCRIAAMICRRRRSDGASLVEFGDFSETAGNNILVKDCYGDGETQFCC